MKKIKVIINILSMFLCPIITFYLFEWYTHNPFTTMHFPIQLLNIFFFECVMLLFFFITGKIKVALILETVLSMVIGLANYYIIQFRAAPIMPWDIYSIRTAASVADNFQYTLKKETLFILLLFLLLLIWESRINISLGKYKYYIRGIGAVLSLILLCGFTKMLHQDSTIIKYRMYDKLFTPTVMSKRDGTAVAFLMELKYLNVSKPAGYQKQEMDALLADDSSAYNSEAEKIPETLPNIIVIMDEAFSDPKILGDFSTNEDYMPFVHSLIKNGKNIVSGNLNVSVLGGNTANTEFEFLTGNSMAFLPQGSIPYQQYIQKELPSIATHLKSLGYQTIAMHPYYSTGWNRDKIYPLLGFSETCFLPDWKNPEIIRKYVSDASSFDHIIQKYDQKETGQPLFLFEVTMQNHSSYTDNYQNFEPDISIDGVKSESLTNYLSLLKLSDSALENLISYFENQEEETIIVFFGDHQPTNSVVEPIWKLQGKSGNDLTDEEEALRYKVPYFIWANYDIQEASDVEISANYLALNVLSTAGIPLNAYQKFLQNLEKDYPVISTLGTVDSSGNRNSIKEQKDVLNTYESLQYYQLFD